MSTVAITIAPYGLGGIPVLYQHLHSKKFLGTSQHATEPLIGLHD